MSHSTKIHLSFLDGIRGIAILSVFLFHSLGTAFGFDQLPWYGISRNFDTAKTFLTLYPLTYGKAGVAIFFVVSGFCIHLSHQRSKDKNWLLFANRRFFRIFPPYIIAICLFFFVWPWGSRNYSNYPPFVQFFSHVLAIHNFDQLTFFGINPSFWSIAVELQLYILYPLLILLTRQLGWKRTLMLIGFLEVSIRLLSSFDVPFSKGDIYFFIAASPFAYWLSWSLGAYLCECFLNKRTSCLFCVRFDLMCLIAIVLPLFRPTDPFVFTGFSLVTVVLIERLMTNKWTLPEHRYFQIIWSHLGLLGIVSYSFYLIHQPIIALTERASARLFPDSFNHPLVKFLICLTWYPLILLFSYLSYHVIEKPSISLGRLIWGNIKNEEVSSE